jgi:hypothetical protein
LPCGLEGIYHRIEHGQLVCINIGVDKLGFRHEALKRAVGMIEIERLEFDAMFGEIIVKQVATKLLPMPPLSWGNTISFLSGCGLG